jgi:hypothetical protein
MKKYGLVFSLILLCSLLIQVASASYPVNPIYGTDANQPTLLASYETVGDYFTTVYHPRQSPYSQYGGWDYLSLPNHGFDTIRANDSYLTVNLNRPAQAVIVFKAPDVPAWLSSWQQGANIGSYPTFSKALAAGNNSLGSNYSGTQGINSYPLYDLLLAEETGQPSIAPLQPTGLETAQPNQSCPAWVENQYRTRGPDGKPYATYHPQIDPIFWCYFQHDHGSDVSLFDTRYLPAFGYAASKAGLAEPNVGFKNFAFDLQGYKWLVTVHQGTSSLGRVCTRYHEVDIVAKSATTGELAAELHFMADFGASLINTSNTTGPAVYFTPINCPTQGQDALNDGSDGIRIIGSAVDGNVNYEAWRLDAHRLISWVNFYHLTFWVQARTVCSSVTCDRLVPTAFPGLERLRFQPFAPFKIDGTQSPGVFYTDPYLRQVVDSTATNATYQYIKPGFSFSLTQSTECSNIGTWSQVYVCGQGRNDKPIERESSIGANAN